MTDYSMTLITGLDDYYYLGEIAETPNSCQIAGLVPVDGLCNTGTTPKILTGTITWNDGVDHTYQIDYFLDVTIVWACGDPAVDITFSGLYVDGVQYVAGSDPFIDNLAATADFAIAINTNVSTPVDLSSCGFTAQVQDLPDITIIPLS